MNVELAVVREGTVPVVSLSGEVDISNARSVLTELLAITPNTALGLVVDLAGTTYLDSQGIHLVLSLAERLADHDQQLRLAVPAESHVRRVLELTHLDQRIPFHQTVEEAVEHIERRDRAGG